MSDKKSTLNKGATDSRAQEKKKIICVMVDTVHFKRTYEIEFESSDASDLEEVSKSLKKKSKHLPNLLESPQNSATFEKQSQIFESDWTAIGDDSPLKDRSKLKLTVSTEMNNNSVSRVLSRIDPSPQSYTCKYT